MGFDLRAADQRAAAFNRVIQCRLNPCRLLGTQSARHASFQQVQVQLCGALGNVMFLAPACLGGIDQQMVESGFVALANIELAYQGLEVAAGEEWVGGAVGILDLCRQGKCHIPYAHIGQRQLTQASSGGLIGDRRSGSVHAGACGKPGACDRVNHRAGLQRFGGRDEKGVGVYINAVIGFDLLLEPGSGVTQQGVDLPDFCQRLGVGSL